MTDDPTVAEVGERELIRRLSRWMITGDTLDGTFGGGDDCAIMPSLRSRKLVLTTDMLIEGTHFIHNLNTDWTAIGRKTAGANISDLAAMGALPESLLVSVALPGEFRVNDVMNLYRGIHDFAATYGARIIGGDTTRSENVCISVTAAGWKENNTANCFRGDARPGDHIYLTGELGGSRAGVELLINPDLQNRIPSATADRLINRHFSPTPRVDMGLALAKLFPRVAIIDISDSLYNEAGLIGEASGTRLEIDIDRIPVSEDVRAFCNEIGVNAQQFAAFSGEEYELLFTLPATPDELRDQLRGAGVECPVTLVGTVNPGGGITLLKGGHPVDPDDETFVHFP